MMHHAAAMNRTAIFVTLLSLMLASHLPAENSAATARTVRGRVMLDANRNGKIDADEKGLAGIAVSDGVNFVTTGADGSFTIDVADDPVIPYQPAQVIAVSWPSGYWPASLWYRRMADLREGEELLFALRKDEQKLPFVMVHSSDPHNNFGGKLSEAETSLRRITGADRKNVLASELLATLYMQTARDPQAVKLYRQILKWEPKRTATMNQLAWLLAVSVNQDVRNGAEALRLATAACEATERKQPGYLDTLAAAQARVGRYEEAIATIDVAIRLSIAGNKWEIVNPMKQRRAMCAAKQAFPSP